MQYRIWSNAEWRQWLLSGASTLAPELFSEMGFKGDKLDKLLELFFKRNDIWTTTGMPNALDFFNAAKAEGIRLDSEQKDVINVKLFGGKPKEGKKAANQSFRRRVFSSFMDECWEELEAISRAAVGYYDDAKGREVAFNEIVAKGEKAGMSPSEVAEDAHLHYLDVASGRATDDKYLFGYAPDEPENMRYDDEFDDLDEYVGWDFIGESRRPYRRARQLSSSVNNMSYSAWRRELMEWLEDNHPRSAYLVKEGGVTEEELRELYEDYNPEDASAMIYMYYEDDPEYRRLMGQSRRVSRYSRRRRR